MPKITLSLDPSFIYSFSTSSRSIDCSEGTVKSMEVDGREVGIVSSKGVYVEYYGVLEVEIETEARK